MRVAPRQSGSYAVQRDFNVGNAIVLGWRQVPRADVDLDGRNEERRCRERRIPLRPERHELLERAAGANMDIPLALLGHGGLPFGVATAGSIVVADEEA